MAKPINPLTLAKAVISAHRQWESSPIGESFTDRAEKALARMGRKNLTDVLQVLKSAIGRMQRPESVRTDNFANDCQSAVKGEEYRTIDRAIHLLTF